ncbi:hypothetical protein P171DRAFT_172271 [Karstenula rhodostoma CBS 690.94]|uniref:Uncharacterized protein n=1 Tax=Karstenula rhodostoma CBS 690.94 TaxID=1392251 RepID=A0A9P4P3S2_9PLEO|nr:hypothetical protein P171DRAFT_172271 [Karstenula rhodostoma CBS 690.94]
MQEHRRFSSFLHRLAERQRATATDDNSRGHDMLLPGPSFQILGHRTKQAEDVRFSSVRANYIDAPKPYGYVHTEAERGSQRGQNNEVRVPPRIRPQIFLPIKHRSEELGEGSADPSWTHINSAKFSEHASLYNDHHSVAIPGSFPSSRTRRDAPSRSSDDVKLATLNINETMPSTGIYESSFSVVDRDSKLFQEGWHDGNVFAVDKKNQEDNDSGYASDSSDMDYPDTPPRPRTPVFDVQQMQVLLKRRRVKSPTKPTNESMQKADGEDNVRQKRVEQKAKENNVDVRSIRSDYGTVIAAIGMVFTAIDIIAVARSSLITTRAAFRRACQRLMRPKLVEGYARITWPCWCGKEVYADFPNAKPDAMQALQDALSNHTPDPHAAKNTSAASLQIPSAAHLGNSITQNTPNSSTSNSTGTNNIVGRGSTAGSSNSLVVPRFLELCINTGKSCQSLGEIDLTRVTCDEVLFAWVRKRYREVRGPRRHWTQYLYKPVAMKFVSFGLESEKGKVHIFQENAYPTAQHVATQTWHYWPCPLEPPLPMPSSAFIHYLCYCGENANSRSKKPVWLPRLPKKLEESLLRSTDPLAHAFGLHIVEGLNRTAILWTLFVVMTVCSGPLLGYVIATRDVQGATGIGGLIVAVLTLVCMSATASMYSEH